jgi:hypothetical protein
MHERMSVDRRREQGASRDERTSAPTPVLVVRRHPLVGAAADAHEREADRLADAVLRSEAVGSLFGATGGERIRASTTGGEGAGRSRAPSTTRIARRATIGPEGGELDDDSARALAAARGGGTPIDARVREPLGAAMGADVSSVRLHSGPRATELNERIQASAFTVGNDVFFRDGLPDAGTPAGMHLLAHEVAHTVQQGASPVNRRIVRRKLIPKAVNAFNAAVAVNPTFATGQKDTDDLAAEADQEDLARVHGRMHTGQDSADAQKVANFVRAVVLTEYSARLRSLETAKDKSGNDLGDKAKAAKKSVYKSKADEFRKKHTPLVSKGSSAPETKGFLKEYGFDSAFSGAPTTAAPAPQAAARIDVRSTFIGAAILGVRVRAHLFIVYTAKDGRQMYFRGGPDDDDYTEAAMGDYVPGTIDWDPSAPSVTLLEGAAAEAKLDALIEATSVINGMKVPYRGSIAKEFGGNNPNKAQELLSEAAMALSSEGENCNATAWTILTRAGISKKKKPSGRHPGWGSILGSKTAGKENALPAMEVSDVGRPYVVDESRDVADDSGTIQVYRDRALFDPLLTVATGTKVVLYTETNEWRRVGVNGKIGYVARRRRDAVYDLLPGWMEALRDKFSDDQIQEIIDNADNKAIIKGVSGMTGIPREYVVYTANSALFPHGDVARMLLLRLELLGDARVRELLENPSEVDRLAKNLNVTAKDVTDVAAQIVGAVEKRLKVPVVLRKHLNDANAENMAANQAPDYPALEAVATELGEDFDWVIGIVNDLRPKQNKDNFLERLLAADAIAQGEMPNVAGYMVKDWAQRTGVTEDFIKQRLVEIHKANEAEKARLKAEAEAKAKAEAAAKAKAAKRKGPKKKKQPAKGKGGAKAKQPEQAPKELVAKPAAPGLPEDLTRGVFYALAALGLEDQAIWELVNDVPDFDDLKGIATDTFVSLQDVIQVAMYYFQKHKGTIQLIDTLKKWPEDMARQFAEGKAPESAYTKVMSMVGLERDFIVERVAAYVQQKWG